MPFFIVLGTFLLVRYVRKIQLEDTEREERVAEAAKPGYFSDPYGEMHDPDMAQLYDSIFGDVSAEDIADRLKMELISNANLPIFPTGLAKNEGARALLAEIVENEAPKSIWCDGYHLQTCNPEDLIFFRGNIVRRAYNSQVYNGIPFDDGGNEIMYIDWFQLKGASKDAASDLLYNHHLFPWEWEGVG